MDESTLTAYGIEKWRQGKVRDLYTRGNELWLVASDRISAFDVILPTLIPDKGVILTQMSRYWFELTRGICPNHVISFDLPVDVGLPEWCGRLTRCRRLEVVPMECVVRGYVAGSAWKEYGASGTVGGFAVPKGLAECEQLPQPLFTPSTKAEAGHDEPLTESEARRLVGDRLYEALRDATLAIYEFAHAYAKDRGILIADTKLEFAWDGGQAIVVDEMLTPDSSRFWPLEGYKPGRPQASFDKQFIRDYLESLDWNKRPPAPELPSAIVEKTLAKYKEALERLTRPGLDGPPGS